MHWIVFFILSLLLSTFYINAFIVFKSDLFEVIKQFQTLIAGTLAFLGAFIAWLQFTENKRRSKARSMSILAIHLHRIVDYSEESMRVSHAYLREFQNISGRSLSSLEIARLPMAPELPEFHIQGLSEAAATTRQNLSRRIVDLVHTFQVQSARLESLIHRARKPEGDLGLPSAMEAFSALKSSMILHAKAGPLFNDARQGWKFGAGISKDQLDQMARMRLHVANGLDDIDPHKQI